MSKGYNNRKRKGKSNKEVLKSVYGSNYVSQYSKTPTAKVETSTKQGSNVAKSSVIKNPDISALSPHREKVVKTSQTQKEIPDNPKTSNNSDKKIKDLLRAVKRFNPDCKELTVNLKTQQITFKKGNVYHIINFKGKTILNYTYHGKHIHET